MSILLMAPAASAAILSSGDVKPEFMLHDTIGSSKNFTMPVDPNSNHGRVWVGDIDSGRLDIDNGWTLNSTAGVIANTSTSGFPDGSHLSITEESTWNVRFDPSNPAIVQPDFDIGLASTASVSVSGGSTLSVEGQTRIGTLNSGAGVVGVNGSQLNTGSLVVGVEGGGSLTVAGSSLNTGFIELGREIGGLGTLILNDADVNSAGGINVGMRGMGNLEVFSSTTVDSHFATFGIDLTNLNGYSAIATAVGNGLISGPSTVWNNSQGLGVAFNTRGSLAIQNQAVVNTGFVEIARWGRDGTLAVDNATLNVAMNPGFTATPAFIVGTEAGSIGHATFTGPEATLTVADGGFLEVARRSADSSLSVSGGADVSTHATYIGTEADSVGVVDLSGAGSNWTGSSFLIIGGAGAGSLVVSGGAALHVSDFLSLGNSAGGSGTLDLSGSAIDPESPGIVIPTTVTSADQIAVGHLGDGFAVVHDGARLVTKKADSATASSGILGHFHDAQGLLEVHGPDSLWTGDGTVNVGFRGIGTLNVAQGGRVESVDGVLARLPGSTGDVTLTGAGSVWNVQNALYVGGRPESSVLGDEGTAGPGGTANLSVAADAYVTVGNSMEIFAAGTVDLSAGGSVTVGEGDPEGEPGALHVYPAGSLSGAGTIEGKLINGGAVSPGNSPGILSVDGNYAQSLAAALVIEIAGATKGTQYDSLDVAGMAMLDGTLDASLVGDFTFAAGNSFEILTATGGISGAFAAQMLPPLSGGLVWNVIYGSHAVVLEVAAPGPAGDYNGNGSVDAADYVVWRKRNGSPEEYEQWRANFGQTVGGSASAGGSPSQNGVPEPASLWLLLAAVPLGRIGASICRHSR